MENKTFIAIVGILSLGALIGTPAIADTITFENGAILQGQVLSISSTHVKFEAENGEIGNYSRADVATVFMGVQTTPPPAPVYTMGDENEPKTVDQPTAWQEGDPEPVEAEVPQVEPEQISQEAPPAQPIEDYRGDAPGTQYRWVTGYWWWYDATYVWVPGYWSVPPQMEYVYVSGYWHYFGGTWVYVRGGWGTQWDSAVVVYAHPRPVLWAWVLTAPYRIVRRHHHWHHYHHRYYYYNASHHHNRYGKHAGNNKKHPKRIKGDKQKVKTGKSKTRIRHATRTANYQPVGNKSAYTSGKPKKIKKKPQQLKNQSGKKPVRGSISASSGNNRPNTTRKTNKTRVAKKPAGSNFKVLSTSNGSKKKPHKTKSSTITRTPKTKKKGTSHSGIKVKKHKKSGTNRQAKPGKTYKPSKTSKPSKASKPSKTRKPSKASKPSKTRKPSKNSKPSKASKPTRSKKSRTRRFI